MTTQEIRDPRGQIIARIETATSGDKIIRDRYGKILGRYDSRTNITRDSYGRMVARGDCLTMLIER